MKFLRADIYGFGKWVDTTFDFSKASLTTFYGENESGKSTLQQFILFVLFGLPPRKRNFYKPKNSNRVGGMLTLEDERIGPYTIERVEDELHCLLPNGKNEDERWLKEKLKGLTRGIYESIYSFSALDLTEIRSMKADQLSDVLFSVGLSGATNIYKVEKQLDNELGELYKKTGRKPLINQQINTVNNLFKNMTETKKKEEEYRNKKTLIEQLIERGKEAEKNVTSCQEKLLTKEKIVHVIPLLHEHQSLSSRLEEYHKTIRFPEDGVNRYQTIKTILLPIKSEYAILQTNKTQYEAKIAMLEEQLLDEQTYQLAESIVNEKHEYVIHCREIEELEKQLDHTNSLLNEQLQHVNLEKNELVDIILPFHLESSWREIREMNVELQRENNKLAEDQQVITQEMNRLQKEKSIIDQNKLPMEEVNQLKLEMKKSDVYDSELTNYELQQKRWLKWKKKRLKTANITLIMASIFFVLLFFVGLSIANYTVSFFSIIVLGIGMMQFFFVKKSIKDMELHTTKRPNRTTISTTKRDEYEKIIHQQEQWQSDLLMIEKEEKRLHFANLQWEERKRLFEQREQNYVDRLETERYQYPFLERIDPAHWGELLRIVQQIKQYIHEQTQDEKQLHLLQEKKEQFEHKLVHLATEIDAEHSMITIEEVEKMIESNYSNLQLVDQYKQLLGQTIKKQGELTEKMTVYQEEIASLFSIAKVQAEEQFFQIAKELEEKQRMTEQLEKIEQQLLAMFSNEWKEQLISKEMNFNELEVEILQLKDEIQTYQKEISDTNKQIAAVELEINQMEMSEDYSEAAFLYQMEHNKLNELAKKWTMLKIAQTTLFHAKKSYQAKHLTEVIAFTSTYFQQLTNGKYKKVFAPTQATSFQVEANNYIRYTVDELSQGTIDQLYVSLRLAISKAMSEKYIIPLMIDDAFVHFDDERTDQVLDVIKQIAKGQQILLFTCKKEIARKLHADHIVLGVHAFN
ncbi:ATP-binding protein [Pseudogracilibacillus auburnensis]|uniref:ATP-binding protein n=1 Tax=Pseudogracilibacillus auburnensis TaxID=1494959 RepID=UPI001A967C56|nr:AAA family ATPase [Pseudogracilibacillus auburnensis]MBO1002916.1 AAA family ATPase [Pseudogracilibacillus auburnensis]